MRWLLIYHNSIPRFVGEFLAIVVSWGLLSAALVALAWPAGLTRPSRRWLVLRNLEVAALSAIIVSPRRGGEPAGLVGCARGGRRRPAATTPNQ